MKTRVICLLVNSVMLFVIPHPTLLALPPDIDTELRNVDLPFTFAKLHRSYADRDSYTYRMTIFGALTAMRRASIPAIESTLKALTAEVVKHGADGLEPLILASVDALSIRADG